MRIVDLNEIGPVMDHDSHEDFYFGGAVLYASLICYYEDDFADSCASMGRIAVIEVDGGTYYGEIVSVIFDDRDGQLDVLLKLIRPEYIY